MALIFWMAALAVIYPYLLYPMVLWLLARRGVTPTPIAERRPGVSLIIPVSNEEQRVAAKVANTAALAYPRDRFQIIFVSDGSTDRTVPLLRSLLSDGVELLVLPTRGGKAAALNAGLEHARHEIVVFSDASIELASDAIEQIVAPFSAPWIGCVSGEDRIAETGGEALYGRYELLVRRLESEVHSIVGASGSFYAQRRALCAPFTPNLAPDFLSVLRTVEQGFRAVAAPAAVGAMTSVKDPRREFERKVRTLIRGMTTLGAYKGLMNPFRYGWFAFCLISHKLIRWLAPLFLLVTFLTSLTLAGSPFYAAAFGTQLLLGLAAMAALRRWLGLDRTLIGKIALYFSTVNGAVLVAWIRYFRGVRQEIWAPSQR